MSLKDFFEPKIAIDLGTANTLVYVPKKGIILNEASVVAFDIRNGEVHAIGNKAKEMIGKSPEHIAIVKPVENGTISDFDITKILIKSCIDESMSKINIFQPKVVITAPAGITDIELRAIEDACIYSGAREVYIVESSIASAVGAGFDIRKNEGRMIINLGAGNTEIAIIISGGIVISKNISIGGDSLNNEIINYIYDKYSLIIGENTANELKEKLSSAYIVGENKSIEVSGRDLLSGMPTVVEVFSFDINEAIKNSMINIIDGIRYVLEKNPPELSSDIIKNGIYITGGGSLISGIDELIENEIGIKVRKSTQPYLDAVNGAGKISEQLKKYLNSEK